MKYFEFIKMHGLGNDFVIIENGANLVEIKKKEILKKIGSRNFGVGCDQILIIESNDFKNADELNFAGAPADSGESESLILNGLEFNTTYYFAIRSNDRWNNVSELSNVVSAATFEAPQILVTPNQISHSVNVGDVLSDTLKISNITSVNSTLQYAVTLENNTFPEKAAKVKKDTCEETE